MTVRLRSRKPYFSAWVPVTGAALALLLCAGFTVLAVLQADKSWTFIMLAILCFLIAGYVLLSASLNKGLTDCVLLSETGATVRRAFKKSVFYPYEQLEVAFGKVDGRECFLFLVKEEAGDWEELLDVSYPVIKGAKHFFAFYSELGFFRLAHEKPLPVTVVFVLLEALGCVCLLASAPVSKTFDAVANVWYRLRKK